MQSFSLPNFPANKVHLGCCLLSSWQMIGQTLSVCLIKRHRDINQSEGPHGAVSIHIKEPLFYVDEAAARLRPEQQHILHPAGRDTF